MSSETYTRPRPLNHAELLSFEGMRHEAAVDALAKEAGKRFWRLEWDENLRWYRIVDAVGRELCPPRPLPELRGFFQNQPPQA